MKRWPANGQIPAYEWNFSDVNPPVHAWSTIFIYCLEIAQKGERDKEWLKNIFQKLLPNFTWWVNRKDRSGRNVFEGGFLGLDNIGVFDRSAPLPTGGYLEQADGTPWMALFCENMLETRHVRERVPGFTFMAEVYWELEWTLQQQGFDYAYASGCTTGSARPCAAGARAFPRGAGLPGQAGPVLGKSR